MMKLTVTISLLMVCSLCNAQTLGDVNRSSSLTWHGIDLTQARFLNFRGDIGASELKNTLATEWAHDPLQETDENFIRRKFGKKSLSVDIAFVRSRNSSINYAASLSSGMHEIDVDVVKKVISELNISGSGFGVLFVVESFDNANNQALVWVAYVDKATKQLISTRRYAATCSSIQSMGKRWNGAVHDIIKRSSQDLRAYR